MNGSKYKTFKAGIHPDYFKELASGKAIKEAQVPATVSIPLDQHIGAPNEPLVSAGDRVVVGQKLGSSDAFVSAPVHSSVSGTVKGIEEQPGFSGKTVKCVIIEADSEQRPFEKRQPKPVDELSADEIRQAARDAGLVGMGGAAFPTHVKLSPPEGKKIDTVIINGCECEPFLTCDMRLMLERPADVIGGLELFMRAVGADRGIVGIEANKMDAVDAIRAAASGNSGIGVEILDVKYPQGAEKQLIYALTGRAVPLQKLPAEVGCLVQNVGTSVAMTEAAGSGKPLYERVLTVTGPGIKEPSNLLVRVGTRISALVEACGGLEVGAEKLVMGGPMTGWAQDDMDVAVVKGTSGLVVLTADLVDLREEHECVRCAKCVDACPMFLMPNYIVEAVKNEDWEKADMWGALDCFECGCCTYTCPAYIPHVDYVRRAKAEIAALKK